MPLVASIASLTRLAVRAQRGPLMRSYHVTLVRRTAHYARDVSILETTDMQVFLQLLLMDVPSELLHAMWHGSLYIDKLGYEAHIFSRDGSLMPCSLPKVQRPS